MKILFIGGTGSISGPSGRAVLAQGHELWLLNRGNRPASRLPAGARLLQGDINHLPDALRHQLHATTWDCVVDWATYTPEQARARMDLFRDVAAHFIFISTSSVYNANEDKTPLTEEHASGELIWPYARAKAQCETVFLRAFQETDFPVTIVRPGHTYCDFTIPTNIQGLGFGIVERLRHHQPILVHNAGQSLWTLTHSEDFALGLMGLFGRKDAMGECFHITQAQHMTWRDIFDTFGKLLGVTPVLACVPSTFVASYDREIHFSLIADKDKDMVFSNRKIRSFVPEYRPSIDFETGLARSLAWHARHPEEIFFNRNTHALVDRIISDYQGS